MKPKTYRHVQPRQRVPLRNTQVRRLQHQGGQDQVQEEIAKFLVALDSYPARAAKEPGITFQQHLSNLFEAREDRQSSRR